MTSTTTVTHEVPAKPRYGDRMALTEYLANELPDAAPALLRDVDDEARRTVETLHEVVDELVEMLNKMGGPDGVQAYTAFARFTELAGYSNTPMTHLSEALVHAGKAMAFGRAAAHSHAVKAHGADE